ncbi:glycosyltransferase family 2 protein [Tellurirhabdus rosea]|uniref:glycosyltransferase family 2 protein n=1 Tax=Tellurirhabdus rosea TaxID=2674997 RepID=UPI00225182F6|nr:glycosyltransferase family 2 protein [Tellurirhabdus rosea]
MSSTKLPLSVVIITRNAERTLLQTLMSVMDWADEIVLVDSGSTDETVSIAQMFGCRVLHRKFDGYGTQKGYAVDQATHDWVLLLDADEVPDMDMQSAIRRVMQSSPDPRQAYSLPRSLVFMGRTFRHSGEHRRPVLRLFNRCYGHVSADLVHEQVKISGTVTPLDGTLLHYSYASLHDYIEKMNRYTSLSAESALAKAVHAGSPRRAVFRADSLVMAMRFLTRFTKIYVLKSGFLDGLPGMVWALLSAIYPVVKHTKEYEKTHHLDKPLRPSAILGLR